MVGRRLQLQERIGTDIAEIIQIITCSSDVAVIIEGEHGCMTTRGIKKTGTKTISTTFRGRFNTDLILNNEMDKETKYIKKVSKRSSAIRSLSENTLAMTEDCSEHITYLSKEMGKVSSSVSGAVLITNSLNLHANNIEDILVNVEMVSKASEVDTMTLEIEKTSSEVLSNITYLTSTSQNTATSVDGILEGINKQNTRM